MGPGAISQTAKKIVILGGSIGGVSTAHYVLRHVVPKLPDETSYQVVLVSASSEGFDRMASPRALISDDMFPQEKLFVSLPKSFGQYPGASFQFVHGTATELDDKARTVVISLPDGGNTEKLEYHALVIATGASTTSPLFSLNRDERFLKETWKKFRTALPTARSIVIAGGGATGIETAGELGEYLNGRAGFFGSTQDKPRVRITVVSAGAEILPQLRPVLAQKAEAYLAKVGVSVMKKARVVGVVPEGAGVEDVTARVTLTLDNGKTLDADLYVPALGTYPNTAFVPKELLQEDGRVGTNPSTLRVDGAGPRVYAIGDASSWARPAVHNIQTAIPVLCENMKRDLLLAAGAQDSPSDKDRLFKEDTRETQMVPIGKTKGVGAVIGFQLPSFLVWAIKGRDYWLWTMPNLWNGKQFAKES